MGSIRCTLHSVHAHVEGGGDDGLEKSGGESEVAGDIYRLDGATRGTSCSIAGTPRSQAWPWSIFCNIIAVWCAYVPLNAINHIHTHA